MQEFREEIRVAFFVVVFLSNPAIADGEADRELISALTKLPRYTSVLLSPDGEKVAAVSPIDGKRVLTVISIQPRKVLTSIGFPGNEEIGEIVWANSNRILVNVWRINASGPARSHGPEMYAINADGSNRRMVFGFLREGTPDTQPFELYSLPDLARPVVRSKRLIRARRQEQQFAHALVASRVPGKSAEVLVSSFPWSEGPAGGSRVRYSYLGDRLGSVLRLNAYSGRTHQVVALPSPGDRAFATASGKVQLASNLEGSKVYQLRDGNWGPVPPCDCDRQLPMGFTDDETGAYLLQMDDRGKSRLVLYDLAKAEYTPLLETENDSVGGIVPRPGSEEPMAVWFEDDPTRHRILESEHRSSRIFAGILKAFEGLNVQITSSSDDGRHAVLRVAGDVLPADYFLADFQEKTVDLVLSGSPWLDPNLLFRSQPVAILRPDGTDLNALLTLPREREEELPMILMPDAKLSVYGFGGYDPITQFLASKGYGILKLRLGAPSSADDVSAAAIWAIGEKLAEAGQICVLADEQAIRQGLDSVNAHPELYACVIQGINPRKHDHMIYRFADRLHWETTDVGSKPDFSGLWRQTGGKDHPTLFLTRREESDANENSPYLPTDQAYPLNYGDIDSRGSSHLEQEYYLELLSFLRAHLPAEAASDHRQMSSRVQD